MGTRSRIEAEAQHYLYGLFERMLELSEDRGIDVGEIADALDEMYDGLGDAFLDWEEVN